MLARLLRRRILRVWLVAGLLAASLLAARGMPVMLLRAVIAGLAPLGLPVIVVVPMAILAIVVIVPAAIRRRRHRHVAGVGDDLGLRLDVVIVHGSRPVIGLAVTISARIGRRVAL